MSDDKIKVGIVGLGRWARVLTRGSRQSSKIEIVKGYSRSQEKRDAFEAEYGVPSVDSLDALLSDPEIKGVICGHRVEDIENPLTQKARYMDKLVDELARGKKMESILRS